MDRSDYERIETAIHFLEKNFRAQPGLRTIARAAGVSEYHFQRLFSRWVGISPKQFLKYLTVEYAKGRLAASRSVLDASFESGLSGPGRLHDLFVTVEGVTPGEFRREGSGLTVTYGVHASPFGACLVAATDRGLCGLSFIDQRDPKRALADLRSRWPEAVLREDPRVTRPLVERIFPGAKRSTAADRAPSSRPAAAPRLVFASRPPAAGSGASAPSSGISPVPPVEGPGLRLLLRGTPFQIKVWQALLQIPSGFTLSYQDVARLVGAPGASRAVGQAIARNPIAYFIPCHRVIRSAGQAGDYRWGGARKKAMLVWEAGRAGELPTLQRNDQQSVSGSM